MSKSSLLAEWGRGHPDDNLECEVYPEVWKGHDVHDDDIQWDIEYDVLEITKENYNTKYKIGGSSFVCESKAWLNFGRDQNFEVNTKNVLPPLSTSINMQILDTSMRKIYMSVCWENKTCMPLP